MSQLAIDDATIDGLRSTIGGEVITPEDSSYDEGRRVWNGRIDRHPALIVSCNSTEDVAAARIGDRRRPDRAARRLAGACSGGWKCMCSTA